MTSEIRSSRRDFLKTGGTVTAGSVLAGLAIPHVHAAEDNTIRLALIGCGGRGSGATVNAFNTPSGPVKLVAMADIVERKLDISLKNLTKHPPTRSTCPRNAASSASTPTRRPSTACARASTSPC